MIAILQFNQLLYLYVNLLYVYVHLLYVYVILWNFLKYGTSKSMDVFLAVGFLLFLQEPYSFLQTFSSVPVFNLSALAT